MKHRLSAVPILFFSAAGLCGGGADFCPARDMYCNPAVTAAPAEFSENFSLPEFDETHYYVFISRSMPEHELTELFQWYEGAENATLVLRGTVNEKNPGAELAALQRELRKIGDGVNIEINPALFRKFGIETVPTIIETGRYGNATKRLAGITDTGYLKKISADQKEMYHDYGTAGQTFEIIERDLTEVMKEKIKTVDWMRKKEQALENFWSRRKTPALPHSAVYRKRKVDLSFTLSHDVAGIGRDEIIYRAGTEINPLKIRKFPLKLIVFDGSNGREIKMVSQYLAGTGSAVSDSAGDKGGDGRKSEIMLVVSNLDASSGWNGFRQLEEYFDSGIFLLTPELIKRFNLEFTPSAVYQEPTEDVITVEELGEPHN